MRAAMAAMSTSLRSPILRALRSPVGGGSSSHQELSYSPGTRRARRGREDEGHVSTRTLLILAAITGVAILTAGAVQILLAR
jgi:hypothetical protein